MFKYCIAIALVCLAPLSPAGVAADRGLGRVLVVCYSRSGASLNIAEKLREMTGGDLHVVETVKAYPTTQPRLYQEPREELERGFLPPLRQPPPDMSAYDTILVGGPVWWFTVSSPLRTFLSQADFKGRRVAGFCTYEGDLGNYLGDFGGLVRNGVVLEGIDLRRQSGVLEPADADARLDRWLAALAR